MSNNSRFSSPTPSRGPSSQISAASGSPPPTHRASFPDPAKEPKRGSSRLSGPTAKQGFCCERDREISKGEDIHIVDAFKTTDGGKATYITYVIRIGVSFLFPEEIKRADMDRHTKRVEDTLHSFHYIRLFLDYILFSSSHLSPLSSPLRNMLSRDNRKRRKMQRRYRDENGC